MKNANIQIELPIASAQVEDILEIYAYNADEEIESTDEQIEIMKNQIALQLCYLTEKILNDEYGLKCKITFDKYAYSQYDGTEILANISFLPISMWRFIINYQTHIKNYIEKTFVSCDGFIPYYSNNYKDWITDYNNDYNESIFKNIETVISVILWSVIANREPSIADDFRDAY